MKKQTKSSWQNTTFIVIASVAFVFALCCQARAQKVKFNVGDKVECDQTQTGRWEKGTILPYSEYDDPAKANYYRFSSDRYPSEDEGRICPVKFLRLLNTAASKENPREQPNEETPANKQKPNETKAGRFKVGDRVSACASQLDNSPDCWKNGTIIKDLMAEQGGDNYQVLVDDPKGGKGYPFYVPSKYVRGGAPPAPATPDCPFNEPTGSGGKNARPSAETFKRVIFEYYKAAAAGRPLGITYETFQLGRSYANRLTNNGLLHDGAPQGAMIYTVKTKFTQCQKYSDSTTRTIYDAEYSCFKDKFGEWVCPSDKTKISDPIYLPNK